MKTRVGTLKGKPIVITDCYDEVVYPEIVLVYNEEGTKIVDIKERVNGELKSMIATVVVAPPKPEGPPEEGQMLVSDNDELNQIAIELYSEDINDVSELGFTELSKTWFDFTQIQPNTLDGDEEELGNPFMGIGGKNNSSNYFVEFELKDIAYFEDKIVIKVESLQGINIYFCFNANNLPTLYKNYSITELNFFPLSECPTISGYLDELNPQSEIVPAGLVLEDIV